MRALRGITLGLLAALLAACGGGGGGNSIGTVGGGSSGGGSGSSSGGSGSGNVLPIVIGAGNYVNGAFTSVTICTPGTSSCQTINNILVDTGSYGLRILGAALSQSLPAQTTTTGATVGECTAFADGYTWGPVATADVKLAGESASSLPVAVFGASSVFPSFPTSAPAACARNGKEEDTFATFGANGVLGVGPFAQDCGSGCASNSSNGFYYACGSTTISCIGITQTLPRQVTNPVADFSTDNNGVLVELPAIGANGQSGVNGSLIFGIGTQSNNALGSARVLTLNSSGNFTTVYKGTTFDAFIDSGSNAFYFADSSIPACTSSNVTGFYCPSSTLSLSGQMIGNNGASVTVPFSVANAGNLTTTNNAAFNDLAGTTGSSLNGFFDWGMPFLFGHNVYFALENQQTSGGVGPYYAF